MSTERLLDCGTADERRLLSSALSDGPSRRAQQRMLLLLGVDPSLSPEPVSATHLTAPRPFDTGAHGSELVPTTAAPTSTSLTSLVSWLGIASVTIGVGVGIGYLARPYVHAQLERTNLPFVRSTPIAATKADPPSVVVAEDSRTVAPAEAAATLPLPPPRAPSGKHGNAALPNDATGLEVQLVDRARMALREGNATSCLQHLDERKRRVGAGMLSPEATLLRIQALVALDRHAAAQNEAHAFLRLCPEGPIAERIQSVLAKSSSEYAAQ